MCLDDDKTRHFDVSLLKNAKYCVIFAIFGGFEGAKRFRNALISPCLRLKICLIQFIRGRAQ